MADTFTITDNGEEQLADDFLTQLTSTSSIAVVSSEDVLLATHTNPTFTRTAGTSTIIYNNSVDRIFNIADPSGTTDDDVGRVYLYNNSSDNDVMAQVTGLGLDYPRGGKFVLETFTIRVG